jgi:hypothetical protein
MQPSGMARSDPLLDNFADDLEHNPRRAVLSLKFGIVALCSWISSAQETKFTTVPLVVLLGGLALLLKGIFLLRKSSERLGLSHPQITSLPTPSSSKNLPSIASQAAQITQDFGRGAFLFWPRVYRGKNFDESLTHPPLVHVFRAGAVLFFVDSVIRRVTSCDRQLPDHD